MAADTEEDMATWVDLVCRVCGLHNYTHESTGQISILRLDSTVYILEN